MDDVLLELFPPTIDVHSETADDWHIEAVNPDEDRFISEKAEPFSAQDAVIEEVTKSRRCCRGARVLVVLPRSSPETSPFRPVGIASEEEAKVVWPSLCPVLTISKLVNNKPMGKGNNMFRRAGTPRCALCRLRELKV